MNLHHPWLWTQIEEGEGEGEEEEEEEGEAKAVEERRVFPSPHLKTALVNYICSIFRVWLSCVFLLSLQFLPLTIISIQVMSWVHLIVWWVCMRKDVGEAGTLQRRLWWTLGRIKQVRLFLYACIFLLPRTPIIIVLVFNEYIFSLFCLQTVSPV